MCQSIGSMERVCEGGGEETYTPGGHVVGMLDRDQRTAKVPTYRKHTECPFFSTSSTSSPSVASSPADTASAVCRGKVHIRNSRGWKSRVRDTAQRLKQVLVVSTCLFSIVSIPGSLSAPYVMEEKMATEPKWILKDLPFQNNGGIVSDNVDPTVQREYLSQITRQATIAKNSAESFMESYLIDKNLNKDHYENKIHSFLPAIPKKLNENISDENEFNMNVKDALVKTYENLQRVAVGLEEATWGELDFESNHHGRNFSPEFKQAESNLKNLLYEMRAVICDLGYEQDLKPDITRSTMPMEQRNLSQVSARYPRDWIVLREYVNNLQYIVELFDKLKDQ